jgi:hypothetical protein
VAFSEYLQIGSGWMMRMMLSIGLTNKYDFVAVPISKIEKEI